MPESNGEDEVRYRTKSELREGIEQLLKVAERSEHLYYVYRERVYRFVLVPVVFLSVVILLVTSLLTTPFLEGSLRYTLLVLCALNLPVVAWFMYFRYMDLVRKMRQERAAMYAAVDMLRDLIPTVKNRASDPQLLSEMRIRLSRLSIGPGRDYFKEEAGVSESRE